MHYFKSIIRSVLWLFGLGLVSAASAQTKWDMYAFPGASHPITLRFADLAEDGELLQWARELAPLMLDVYPEWAERHVSRWLGGKSDFLKA